MRAREQVLCCMDCQTVLVCCVVATKDALDGQGEVHEDDSIGKAKSRCESLLRGGHYCVGAIIATLTASYQWYFSIR